MLIDTIISVLFSILKSHLYLIGIIIGSFIIESITGLKLFIDNYLNPKSPKNADAVSSRDTFLYFVLNLVVFLYDINTEHIELNFISIFLWFAIIIFLTKYFFRLHKKYQKVDHTKSNDDYS